MQAIQSGYLKALFITKIYGIANMDENREKVLINEKREIKDSRLHDHKNFI